MFACQTAFFIGELATVMILCLTKSWVQRPPANMTKSCLISLKRQNIWQWIAQNSHVSLIRRSVYRGEEGVARERGVIRADGSGTAETAIAASTSNFYLSQMHQDVFSHWPLWF